ncbi:MAG: HDOD domain-containing protein [Lysinibacillus sp.]
MELLIYKQPIFNRRDEIVSYELFYRGKQFSKVEDDTIQATIELLINAFLSFGAQKITQNKRFFTKFPQQLIMGGFLNSFEHEQLIIELDNDFIINEALVNRIAELKSFGFQISLDSALLAYQSHDTTRLLKYIDYCTVDISHFNSEKQQLIEHYLTKQNPHIHLLARNVHDRLQIEQLKHYGFVLFQGSYFMEPETVTSEDIPSIVTNYFELLSLFHEEIPSIGEIAEIIEQDVSLSYKILQLAKNASNQLHVNITSIRQAIMIIGLLDLQKWIYLLALRENKPEQSDIERELLRASLLRAKVCEQFARNKLLPNYAEFFLVGMFSNIDSLLASPMEIVMEQLPFSTIVKQTLVEGNTEISPFLTLAINLDKLQFDKIYSGSITVQIPLEQVELIYSNAQSWVDSIFESMDQLNTSISY